MTQLQRLFRQVAAVGVGAAVAYFVSFKLRWTEPRPERFAALVGVASVGLVGMLVGAGVRLARRRGQSVSALAEACAAAGLLAVAAGGGANWAFGMQGFVVLEERAPLRLSRTSEILAFTHGPLADLRELELTIALGRLELAPEGSGGFRPVSRLRILDAEGEERPLAVSRAAPGRFRTLVFRQGAFGFAPRVVVARGGRAVLDAYVPFRTLRAGPDGVSFLGDFEIEAESLAFHGAVTLENLNEDMKGHPRLELAAKRDGEELGTGSLAPGDVAELGEGYTVAFAGLKRWSEIDLSRRTYPAPILGGALAFAIAAAAWAIAAWRGW